MAELLLEIGIALTAAAVAGTLAVRVGQSVIPAYIGVGILVGPNPPMSIGPVPLTLVETGEHVDLLAELGIVLLLFFLGLEFSVDRLVANRDRVVRAGALDFASNFGVGLALGFAFGTTLVEALFVAGVVYVSSSAIVTKSLLDTGWIANPESEPILGTLVVEDVVIAIYLALLAGLVLGGGDIRTTVTAVATAVAFLGIIAAIAWRATDQVERLFDVDGSELFLLRVLGVTVLVAGFALAIDVSEAVAAFFVGAAVSSTEHADRIERTAEPVRDLFAAFFFVAIGLQVDVTVLPGVAGLLAAAVVATTASKIVSGTLAGRDYGFDRDRALRVGVGLVPRGEFSLVLAALAAGSGHPALASIPAFAVGYVLAMSVLGSLLIRHEDALSSVLSPWLAGGDPASR